MTEGVAKSQAPIRKSHCFIDTV